MKGKMQIEKIKYRIVSVFLIGAFLCVGCGSNSDKNNANLEASQGNTQTESGITTEIETEMVVEVLQVITKI